VTIQKTLEVGFAPEKEYGIFHKHELKLIIGKRQLGYPYVDISKQTGRTTREISILWNQYLSGLLTDDFIFSERDELYEIDQFD